MENLYHEKQKLLLCGLCAVNNILQKSQYTKQSMNELADQLPNVSNSFFNQHSNIFKLGNYSADLLITALEKVGKKVAYFDKRKFDTFLNYIQDNRLIGIIVNKVQKSFLFTTNHWFTILYKDQKWYNLDGKLNQYICLGGDDELMNFLRKELQNLSIFLVYDEMIQELNQIKQIQQMQNTQQNSNKQQINIEQEQTNIEQEQTNIQQQQQIDNQEHLINNEQNQIQTLKEI